MSDFRETATDIWAHLLSHPWKDETIEKIEQALRDVQRETAEECYSLGSIDVIKERFGLEEKP